MIIARERSPPMFPTPEYTRECIKHQEELREEYKKRGVQRGDVVYRHGLIGLVVYVRSDEPHPYVEIHWPNNEYFDNPIWLPRLDQLIEMLEERGYGWRVAYYYGSEWDNRQYEVTLAKFDAIHSDAKGTDDRDFIENVRGPDPACALLRAWLEVVSHGDPRRGKEE